MSAAACANDRPGPTPEVHVGQAFHALDDGHLELLGAVSCVTGAMTRLELPGARVLVDCGIAQGEEAQRWRLPVQAHDVDVVVLTHAHHDHVGSLPALLERGFAGPILGTAATLAIARLVLDDGMRIEGHSTRERRRVLNALAAQGRAVRYGDLDAHIPGLRGRLALREAGHILGSASVELVTAQSRVVISGDLGRPDSPVLRDYETQWSSGPRPVDLAVLESTYGDRDHRCNHGDIEANLERIVRRAADVGGHVLVPAFAIGRTQTLLWHLNALVEAKRLPAMPVAVDSPLGLRVTETYAHARALYDAEARARLAQGDDPLDFRDLYAVHRAGDSARLSGMPGPMLIIAGSGMCTGGRIVGHLRALCGRPSTTVVFAGYQARGTPGRAIQDAARSGAGRVRLDGEEVAIRCRVETLQGLSAHADRTELVRWARHLPGLRRVALHHGEPAAQRGLAMALQAAAGEGRVR